MILLKVTWTPVKNWVLSLINWSETESIPKHSGGEFRLKCGVVFGAPDKGVESADWKQKQFWAKKQTQLCLKLKPVIALLSLVIWL